MQAQWYFALTLLTAHVAVGHVIGSARAADNQTRESSRGNASSQPSTPVFFVENPAIHATVRFRSGEARLDSHALAELRGFMKAASRVSEHGYHVHAVGVFGHADSSGSPQHNQRLSEKRANSVADWLRKQGIPSSAIEVLARGDREPSADNTTDVGRTKNRRVELQTSIVRTRTNE